PRSRLYIGLRATGFPDSARTSGTATAAHPPRPAQAASRSRSKKPIEPIKRRYPIGFSHGRVVEGGIDEVLQRIGFAWLVHDRLANMHDLRGLVAKAVHTQHLQG